MTDSPIACSLTPGDMTARLALIEALAADGLLERTPTESGVRARFSDRADIEQRVRELVAAESECCPFLDFDLRRADGDLVLDISGPADARAVIDQFFDDFSPPQRSILP